MEHDMNGESQSKSVCGKTAQKTQNSNIKIWMLSV